MHRHASFELWLHDDAELAAIVGAPVVERTTIHQWPLSCVQRLRTGSGRKYLYKVQAPPTIEAEFYSRARSPLLVEVRVLESAGTTVALLMDEVEAPRLDEVKPAVPQAVEIAAELCRRIAEIEGDVPTLADIGGEDLWAAYFGTALEQLQARIADGSFRAVDQALLARLGRVAASPSVLGVIRSPAGLVHSDLMAGNVLVAPGGYRVLDWQRPLRGPAVLDAATLLLSLEIDPLPHVPLGAVQLHHLLHIAWYAQAAERWYPAGRPRYDGFITQVGERLAALDS